MVPDDLGIDPLGGRARPVRFGAVHDDRSPATSGGEAPVLAADEISLPGAHNRANAMAAAATCLARGIELEAVAERPADFAGVATGSS